MIMLGGGYLPGDDDRAPWLRDARRLVGQALAEGCRCSASAWAAR
ncbi:hypothetical protein ACFQYP_09385 [Nonomuraea antimicrobica]